VARDIWSGDEAINLLDALFCDYMLTEQATYQKNAGYRKLSKAKKLASAIVKLSASCDGEILHVAEGMHLVVEMQVLVRNACLGIVEISRAWMLGCEPIID
jgi:hypothetical protein